MLSFSIEIDSMEVRKHPTLFMNRLVPKLKFTKNAGAVIKYLTNVSSDNLYDL